MTYTGRPSRGCQTCRNGHVKCDESRPRCRRCVRLKRVCSGYRDDAAFLFRAHSGNPVSNSASCRKLGLSIQGCSHDLLSRPLSLSYDDQKLCYFYEFILTTVPESDRSRYLHQQLPSLYSQTRQDSVLYLATQAISYAVWAKSRNNDGHAIQVSRKRYVKAIAALKTAIQHPIEVKSDDTLYAVLLLSGYETIMFDSKALSAWGSHVDGAVAILKARGRERLFTSLQCNMFLFIRRNAVHSHVQLSRPIDPVFHELMESVRLFENTEDKLISKTIKVPQLQCLANDILSQPNSSIEATTENEILDLIWAVKELDQELAEWARDVPSGWSYSVAINLNFTTSPEPLTPSYAPNEIHTYSDFYIARVWNLYRISRLILQSILIRASSWPGSPSDPNTRSKVSKELINDICASVPFLLGYELSSLKRPIPNTNSQDDLSIWPQNSASDVDTSKHTGRFSLIWPLYISCSVPSIAEPQQLWMQAQLKWIARYDIPQAQSVSEAQSQTLLGGTEAFTFDCV